MLSKEILNSTKDIFKKKIENRYQEEIIGNENIFTDLGIDSLLLMEIIIELEDFFDITFDDEKLNMGTVSTIDQISTLIQNSMKIR